MRNPIHRHLRRKYCDGKVSFLTREDACHAMCALLASAGPQTHPLSVYKHPKCGGFHVGHMPREIRKKFGFA